MENDAIFIIVLIGLATIVAMAYHYNEDKNAASKKQPIEDAPARTVIPQKTEQMPVTEEMPVMVVGATPLTSIKRDENKLLIVFSAVSNVHAIDDIESNMVDILKKIGEYPEKKFLSTEDAEKTVLSQYEALTSDNVFLNPCHRQIAKKHRPNTVLFQPRYNTDYYSSAIYVNIGSSLTDANSDNSYRKLCHVIGLGGVYLIDVMNVIESKFFDVRIRHEKSQPWSDHSFLYAFSVTTDISAKITKVVDMPSITQHVIEKMKSKDMTNIPYVGETYRAAGYQVVQIRLDNETYVFCSSKGYLDRMNDFSDVRKDTLVDQLVELRSSRNPELEVTDYGYVWKKDVAPVHWYV